MVTPWKETADERPLGILGISEAEEKAYRWLLASHGAAGATVADMANAWALSKYKTQQLLEALEEKGLATHTPEKPRRFIASSPDIAMKALIIRRQKDMENAQLAVQKLQEQTEAAQKNDIQEQMVELITNRETERQVFDQMMLTAQEEVVALVRRPMRVSRLNIPVDENHASQRESTGRGVRYRNIVDTEFLELPGALHSTQEDTRAGQKTRVVSNLPFKLVLVDRRMAVIPLSLKKPDGPSLLVRSSALLDALYALFESLWERAEPLFPPEASAGNSIEREVDLHQPADNLFALLTAGLSDKAIAYDMAVSTRTVRRRLNDIMDRLGARTRFQAGWLAARAEFKGPDNQGTFEQ